MMWHYVWWCGHYRQERGSCRRWGSRCLLCSWSTLVIGRFVLISSIFCWQPFGEWHSLSCSVLTNFFIHELLDASVDLRFMHTHTQRERQTRTDRHMYICMYICMYVCIYVCMYVCICTHIHVYVYTCIHILILIPPHPHSRRSESADQEHHIPNSIIGRSSTIPQEHHKPEEHHKNQEHHTPNSVNGRTRSEIKRIWNFTALYNCIYWFIY